MSVVYELDSVVRSVSSEVRPGTSDQVLVHVDGKGRATEKRPLFGAIRTYLVDRGATAEFWREDLSVVDGRSTARISLKAFCRLSCPDAPLQLVSAIAEAGARTPLAILHDTLQKQLLELAGGKTEQFLSNLLRTPALISDAIEANLERELGLRGTVEVVLVDARKLEPLEFGARDLEVPIQDIADKARLKIKSVRLEVSPDHAARALLSRVEGPEIFDRIQASLRSQFGKLPLREALTLGQRAGLDGQIMAELQKLLDPLGRILAAFHASLELDQPGEEDLNRRIVNVTCVAGGQTVQVQNEILLILEDPALTRNTLKNESLESWLARELQNLVQSALFGVQYAAIFTPQFSETKALIESEFRARAKTIGYSVRQIITTPNVEILDHPFPLEIKDSFAVNQLGRSIGLLIEASLVIPNPEGVAELLNRGVNLAAHFRKLILERLRVYCHRTSPVRFYTEFEPSDDQSMPAVKEEIEALVHGVLAPAGVVVEYITIKVERTEVEDPLRALLAHHGHIDLMVQLATFADSVPYTITYRIVNVLQEGWERLVGTTPATVDGAIAEEVAAALATWPPALVLYNLPKQRAALQKALRTVVKQCVEDHFGLDAYMISARRGRSHFEEQGVMLRGKETMEYQLHENSVREKLRAIDDQALQSKADQLAEFDRLIKDNMHRPERADDVAGWTSQRDALAKTLPRIGPPPNLRLDPMTRAAGLLPSETMDHDSRFEGEEGEER